MLQRSRTRQILKCSGAAASALLVIAFGTTGYSLQSWPVNLSNRVSVTVMFGALWIEQTPELPSEPPVADTDNRLLVQPPRWQVEQVARLLDQMTHPVWWPTVNLGNYSVVIVPLWIPLLLIALPTARVWWLDRRRPALGHCTRCGYDLTGNVSGRCPECGTATSQTAATAESSSKT
jgi:hypothetical protein